MSKVRQLDTNFEFDSMRCWDAVYPPKYQITEELLRLKHVYNKSFLPSLSFTFENSTGIQAFLAVKADPNGTLFGRPNLNRIHISAFAYTKLKHGKLLLEHFLNLVPKNQSVVFGQDQGHFFPGVPTECPELINLLLTYGFEKSELVFDLERDLRDFHAKPEWLQTQAETHSIIRPCTQTDLLALQEFFGREFPGRWHYDTVVEKCQTWKEYSDIIALWQGDTIEGFAYTQNYESTSNPTAGYVWKADLGPNSGALGPIGVSERVRGQKLGGALLVASLEHLKQLGVRQCIIDWTSLTGFYQKYGFTVNRRYQPMIKPAHSE